MKRNSDKLDRYLGKKVKITFFDNDVKIGVLEKSPPPYKKHSYKINTFDPFCTGVMFCKTHVKKIEEAHNG